MRKQLPDAVEKARLLKHDDEYWGTNPGTRYGAFYVPTVHHSDCLCVIANDASQLSSWWEHVSVSLPDRTPNWEEMCLVKSLFWGDDECVVQYHVPASDHVNYHPYTLHMWKPTRHKDKLPRPPADLVGPKIVTTHS